MEQERRELLKSIALRDVELSRALRRPVFGRPKFDTGLLKGIDQVLGQAARHKHPVDRTAYWLKRAIREKVSPEHLGAFLPLLVSTAEGGLNPVGPAETYVRYIHPKGVTPRQVSALVSQLHRWPRAGLSPDSVLHLFGQGLASGSLKPADIETLAPMAFSLDVIEAKREDSQVQSYFIPLMTGLVRKRLDSNHLEQMFPQLTEFSKAGHPPSFMAQFICAGIDAGLLKPKDIPAIGKGLRKMMVEANKHSVSHLDLQDVLLASVRKVWDCSELSAMLQHVSNVVKFKRGDTPYERFLWEPHMVLRAAFAANAKINDLPTTFQIQHNLLKMGFFPDRERTLQAWKGMEGET